VQFELPEASRRPSGAKVTTFTASLRPEIG
jgi:hypothetical protein